jgi:sortase A
MAIRVYLKEDSSTKKKVIISLSHLSLTLGILLLFWSFYPVISFEIYSRFIIKNKFIAPISSSTMASSLQQAGSILSSYDVFSNNLRDFTQARLWFPNKQQTGQIRQFAIREYYLTIPKLNIFKARVLIGGEDLSKGLIHYLPTSLPGEYGNVAIFGHSTLPQLFNVKDYKTIFTYLPSIEKGNSITVDIGDLKYDYEVFEMFVVKPDQVSVLEQKYDASYLTLITCVPPGTYWQRLVVKAKLTKFP